MVFPPSERLEIVTGPDGQLYNLDFWGENEGRAVISGPKPIGGTKLRMVPEVYSEPADSPVDARIKLNAFRCQFGWPQ